MMTGIMKESFLAKPERRFLITRIGFSVLIMSLEILSKYYQPPFLRPHHQTNPSVAVFCSFFNTPVRLAVVSRQKSSVSRSSVESFEASLEVSLELSFEVFLEASLDACP